MSTPASSLGSSEAAAETAVTLRELRREQRQLAEAIGELETRFASPAAELAKYVGQAVFVVRADRTGQGALEDAISLLSACPNIQLLLNAVHFSPSGRRFGSYYGYGG